MKRIVLPLLVGLALGAGSVWFAVRRHTEPDPLHDAVAAPASGDSGLLSVDADTRTRMGLVVRPVAATHAVEDIRGEAHVLDASILLQQESERTLARLAHGASRREWERLKILFTQGQNASARAYEAGEAAEKRDAALALGAETRLLAGWGGDLAGRSDLPDLVRRLARFEAALVRMEFPPGSGQIGPSASVTIATFADPEVRIPVEWIGPAPSTDPLTQGRAFLGLVSTPGFVPGTALIVRAAGAVPREGVFVPSSAVVRQDGDAFVFGDVDGVHFARLPVRLGLPLPGGWLVTEGLTNDQRVVVTGAQSLLSAELKPQEGGE